MEVSQGDGFRLPRGDNGAAGAGTWLSPSLLVGQGEALSQRGGGVAQGSVPSCVSPRQKMGEKKARKTSIITLVLAPAESPAAFPSLARFLFRRSHWLPGGQQRASPGMGFWVAERLHPHPLFWAPRARGRARFV